MKYNFSIKRGYDPLTGRGDIKGLHPDAYVVDLGLPGPRIWCARNGADGLRNVKGEVVFEKRLNITEGKMLTFGSVENAQAWIDETVKLLDARQPRATAKPGSGKTRTVKGDG